MNSSMLNIAQQAMKTFPSASSRLAMMLTVATRAAFATSSANESRMAGQKLRPFIAMTMNAFLQ